MNTAESGFRPPVFMDSGLRRNDKDGKIIRFGRNIPRQIGKSALYENIPRTSIRRGVLVKWSLLRRIELFLKRAPMRPTRFGLEAAGDPKLVFQLRRGRVARPPMEKKILAYLDWVEGGSQGLPPRRRRR
jgi:hypothetical protein